MPMPFDFVQWAFWAKKLIAVLILPPAGPLLLIGLGLLLRRLRALAWVGWTYALVASLPVAVNSLAGMIEPAQQPVRPEAVAGTGAIVILGAGVRSDAPEFPEGETVGRLALERLRYGALLARQSGKPILVSGGAPRDGIIEAVHMRTVLEQEFGVPVRWAESQSLDTRDNADFTARILGRAGISSITLVTHATHMPRARRAFESAGLRVVAAPTVWIHNPGIDYQWSDFIPSPRAAYDGWFVVHELLGNLAYRFTESSAPIAADPRPALAPASPPPSAGKASGVGGSGEK